MEGLGVDVRLIVIQIINFTLLLFVLVKFLYRPVLKVLDERKKKIAESLRQAQKINEDRLKLEGDKKEELKHAKIAGKEIMDELRREGEKEKNEIIIRAQTEAEKITQKAREQIILEREKLREEIKAELADLSIAVAEKVLGEKFERQKENEFLTETLKTIKKGGSKSITLFELAPVGKKRISPEAEKIAQELLTLLKKTQNLRLLPEILEKLENNLFESASVITATGLKSDEEKKIRMTLAEVFGDNLKIEFQVNPKIMGGMIVKVGDRVFDNSLLGRTRQLKESIERKH